MMEQRVWVRLFESCQGLVDLKGFATESLRTCLGETATMLISIPLDLLDRICEVRLNLRPLILGEHRYVHLAAPAVDRARHRGAA